MYPENKELLAILSFKYYMEDPKKFFDIANALEKNVVNSEVLYLKGNIYSKTNNLAKAKECFLFASNICPNRFKYKYALFNIYLKEGATIKAKNMATIINKMPEKIPSAQTKAIKMEIKDWLHSNKE